MVGHPLRRPGSYWSLFSQETRITIFEQCSLASFEAPPEYTAPSEQDLGYKNIPLTEVSRENLAAEPTHSMHPRAAPVLLTHVCRSWRLLALATSQLWTRFKIIMTASPTWENPSVKLTFPFAAMEAQVERCGEFYSGRGGDLEVVLELPSYIRQRTEDALSVAFKFSLLLNLVMAPDVIERWRSLSVPRPLGYPNSPLPRTSAARGMLITGLVNVLTKCSTRCPVAPPSSCWPTSWTGHTSTASHQRTRRSFTRPPTSRPIT